MIWPLRRRRIRRASITNVRHLDRKALRRETGRAMRVGAGGLWGAFGWLWTTRRGIVRMYVSKIVITPEQPDVFVHALSGSHS